MSFYMGGQRFKSRAPAPAQPQQQMPLLDNADVHPLRQHSISQDNSPTIPTKQPIAADPTSYAARTQGRPPLSVDTTPLEQDATDYASQDLYSGRSPTTSRRPARKDSVPERSPLQQLEGTLGNISKGEKRARVEEAERHLRARREGGTGSTRSIPRKPVGSVNGGTPPIDARQSRRNHRSVSDGAESLENQRQRQSSLGLDPFPSRDRRYGYDASRTGGAAAAAVDAYQLARQPHLAAFDEPSESHYDDEHLAHLDAGQTSFNNRTRPRGTAHTGSKSTGNREPHNVPKSQKVLGEERAGSQTGAPFAKTVRTPDPVAREEVRRNEPGPTYSAPPQTAAGQEAREAVGLDTDEAAREEYGGRGGRLKFSQVIHPFSDGTGRRYKDVDYLQDWRQGATGTLTAEDISDDPSANQQAWWEREQGSSRSGRGRSAGAGNLTVGTHHDRTGKTAFDPPLSLRCGPLLRYTGIRGASAGSTNVSRRFWRGSAMIVTEDATSSTEAPPVLRLFYQPRELYNPPAEPQSQPNGEVRRVVEDPIAGETKCGPKGETLYVKHVSHLTPETDLSLHSGEEGLFSSRPDDPSHDAHSSRMDGEKLGRFKEVKGHKLHHERGLTFWRFHIEVELGSKENRIAYRINDGPANAFWVPARNQSMSIMFHSCNGFSLSVDPNKFSGPDPLWRDVLNTHQQKPFHVMIGGGDQIYNDAVMHHTHHFKQWLETRNPAHKYGAPFSELLQDELENFYLHRYAMWFSQGLFGLANAQIPMVNIWDDHDIIDGYGSYPHHFMSTPIFTGLGAVAFKYYMLFQHQSLPLEDHKTEPSWILGPSPGPYINQQSRSVYMSLGGEVAFVGLDCRTERMQDEVLSYETYEVITDRLEHELEKGAVKHLIVLLGIPIAYPRMTFAENILTSRTMEPIKALARTGIMGGVINKFDGGIEVLDDLNDHWTAKHHKIERKWLIEDLQDFAAEKSVRITILGGDVHLAAAGQFFSKKKLAIPKDHDHRYMPNIISSAIVNTPPPEAMADFLNKRNKIHHLDDVTDEDMIPLFTYDVDGQSRNNHHLLPRRNYCTIRPYIGDIENSPPPSVFEADEAPPRRRRSFSLSRRSSASSQNGDRKPGLLRRLSSRVAPPSSYRGPPENAQASQNPYYAQGIDPRVDGQQSVPVSQPASAYGSSTAVESESGARISRSNSFLRRPNIGANPKAWDKDPSGRQGHIDLAGGLEVVIRCEINQKDPSGKTQHYRLIVPALDFQKDAAYHQRRHKRSSMAGLLGSIRRNKSQREPVEEMPYEANEPATPAMAGDQRYTTMMEGKGMNELASAETRNTNRAAAAKALDGEPSQHRSKLAQHDGPSSPRGLRERATLDSLPRSGVVETQMPAEVPRQPYHEQRRGSLDRHRAHAFVGRSRSLSDRSNSFKRAHADQSPDSPDDRAYWGAKQVRGELPLDQPASKNEQEKGLRRYYASAFGSSKKQNQSDDNGKSAKLPMQGLAPPLGAVNNRLDLMPTKPPNHTTSGANQRDHVATDGRRVVSDPTQDKRQAALSKSNTTNGIQNHSRRVVNKDPYAHYMPEAVEAEFQSEGEVSDLDDYQYGRSGRNHDGASDVSSLEEDRLATKATKRRDDSFASAQTNREDYDSPLYSDEDELRQASHSRTPESPEVPARSPERDRHGRSQPHSRPLSKVERLTGASSSGQRASYASGHTMPGDEDLPMARPVGQAASGKAAKMLGADPNGDLDATNGAGMGRTQSASTGGRFGGLMRRISEQGGKTRKRLSANGGAR